jgi:hypothetical protein
MDAAQWKLLIIIDQANRLQLAILASIPDNAGTWSSQEFWNDSPGNSPNASPANDAKLRAKAVAAVAIVPIRLAAQTIGLNARKLSRSPPSVLL